jgi:hypothetical protein
MLSWQSTDELDDAGDARLASLWDAAHGKIDNFSSNEIVAANLDRGNQLDYPPRNHSRACAKSAAKKPS